MFLRILNLIILSGLLIFAAGCVDVGSTASNVGSIVSPIEVKENHENHTEVDGIENLVIDGYAGDILILQDNEINDVKFESKLVVRGHNEVSINEAVEKLILESEISDNQITLKVKSKRVMNKDVNSLNNDYVVYIPTSIENLTITNDTGDIKVEGLFNSVRITADVGDITFNGITDVLESTLDVGDVKMNGYAKKASFRSDVGDLKLIYNDFSLEDRLTVKNDVSEVRVYLPQNALISKSSSENIVIKSDQLLLQEQGITIKNNSTSLTGFKVYDVNALN